MEKRGVSTCCLKSDFLAKGKYFGLFFSAFLIVLLLGFVAAQSVDVANSKIDLDKIREHQSKSIVKGSDSADQGALKIDSNIVQYGAVLNVPVKWKKDVTLSKPSPVSIKIPKSAMNISISKTLKKEVDDVIVDKPKTDLGGNDVDAKGNEGFEVGDSEKVIGVPIDDSVSVEDEIVDVPVASKDKEVDNEEDGNSPDLTSEVVVGSEESVSDSDVQDSVIEETESDVGSDTESDSVDASVETQNKVEEPVIEVGITGKVTLSTNTQVNFRNFFLDFFSKFPKITGFVTGSEFVGETQTIEIKEEVEAVEIEYYTEAPYAIENLYDGRKEVKIIGPEDVHYQDVLAYTEISESWGIKSKGQLRLYWQEGLKNVDFTLVDRDINGVFDSIEFVVEHLSEQTFDIIVITNAEHLDANRSFISDIYDEVHELDEVWSEEIPEGDYVRVTFEKNLTNERDITVYPRTILGNPSIKIYEENGQNVIAQFDSLIDNRYNRVILTGLEGEQDTFDLRILGGSVEFDHIIDPPIGAPPDINFTSPTPASGSTQTNTDIYVNVSSNSTGNGDHYSFVDFDNSLVGWWRFDSVSSTTLFDESPYGRNGTIVGTVPINTTGYWGNASHFGVVSGNNINLGSFPAVSGLSEFSVSIWIRKETAPLFPNLLSKSGGGNDWGRVYFEVSEARFLLKDDANRDLIAKYPNAATDTDWHHIVGVLNGTNVKIFVDGVQGSTIATWPSGNFTADVPHDIVIGSAWNGSVDDFMFFSRSLSNAEVLALYNASAVQYQNNFTALAVGNHTFTAYAVDVVGNKNNTEERTVTINISDLEYPTFSGFVNDTANNTAYSSGALYGFNATVIRTNGTIGLEFNGVNYTASNLSSTLFNATASDLGAGTYNYYWFGWGNGSNNLYNSSSLLYYTVGNATGNVEVYLNSGIVNVTVEKGASVTYNASLLAGEGTLTVYLDGTAVASGSATTNSTTTSSVGAINVTATFAASQNYTTDSQTRWIHVVDTTSPIVTVNLPVATTYGTNNLPLNFNVSLNENGSVLYSLDSGVTNISMAGDQGVFGTVFNHTNSTLTNGTYVFRVYANDTSGNENNTASVTFDFDSIAPGVTINSPLDINYSGITISFNVTTDEDTNAIYFTLDNGVNNITMQNNGNRDFNHTNSSIADGPYAFRVYANDTYNNVNASGPVSFIIDNANPLVVGLLPDDDSVVNSSLAIEIGANVSDALTGVSTVLANVTLPNGTVQGVSLSLITGTTKYNNTYTTPSLGGVYTLLIYANDTAGNVNSTETTSFNVTDVTPPAVSINVPTATTYATSSLGFNVTLNENGSVIYSLDLGINNVTMQNNGNRDFNHTNSSIADGDYTFSAYANDSVGNKNYTVSVDFAIDTTAPGGGSGSGSGGGGGGGGGPSLVTQDEAGFVGLSPSESSIDIVSGFPESRIISLKNDGAKRIILTFVVESIEDLVTLDKESVTLAPGEESSLIVTISSFDKGLRIGKIIVKSGSNVVKEHPIVLNFRGGDYLFDSLISIDSSQRRIRPGETLRSEINLLQVIEGREVDVNANYIIEDLSGKVYLEESETFFVLNEKTISKEFSTESLPVGEYVLGLEIVYPGGFATSSTRFAVVEGLSGANLYFVIGILALILVAVFVYLKFIRSFKGRRK